MTAYVTRQIDIRGSSVLALYTSIYVIIIIVIVQKLFSLVPATTTPRNIDVYIYIHYHIGGG